MARASRWFLFLLLLLLYTSVTTVQSTSDDQTNSRGSCSGESCDGPAWSEKRRAGTVLKPLGLDFEERRPCDQASEQQATSRARRACRFFLEARELCRTEPTARENKVTSLYIHVLKRTGTYTHTLQLSLHLPHHPSLLLLLAADPNLAQRLLQNPLIRLPHSIPRQRILKHHQHRNTMLRQRTGDEVDDLLRRELADELGADDDGGAVFAFRGSAGIERGREGGSVRD